ncbi:hypothetical protein ACWEJ6_51395 [Nonomuraea sp. NPDC004702]
MTLLVTKVNDTDHPQLADAIMQQANAATAAVSEQSRQLLAPLMPDGLPYEDVFGSGPRSAPLCGTFSMDGHGGAAAPSLAQVAERTPGLVPWAA